MERSSQLCARARFWASLRIDGELSELEGALLDAHLARCADCRGIAEEFGSFTADLRRRPLERVEPVLVARTRRAPKRAVAGALIAAVLAVGVLLGGFVRGQVSSDALKAPRPVAIVASFDTPDLLRELRRTTLLNQRRVPRDMAAEPV